MIADKLHTKVTTEGQSIKTGYKIKVRRINIEDCIFLVQKCLNFTTVPLSSGIVNKARPNTYCLSLDRNK